MTNSASISFTHVQQMLYEALLAKDQLIHNLIEVQQMKGDMPNPFHCVGKSQARLQARGR
jgi:hypothetical protein